MDERIRRRLEDYLSGSLPAGTDLSFDRALEARPEAREELRLFAEQSEAIRVSLRAPEGIGPAPGFYARVMARVEEESRASVWSLFTGVFGQRLIFATSMLVVLLGVALMGTDSANDPPDVAEAPAQLLVDPEPDAHLVGNEDEDRGRVFVTLASYGDYQ
jgi:anti-sigma factor RsiW